MAACRVAAKVIRVVTRARIHIDQSVPMITYGISGLVEQQIVGGGRKTSPRIRFLHPVTNDTDKMQRDIGHIAVVYSGGDTEIGAAVGWVSVTGGAVQGKGGRRIVTVQAIDSHPTDAVQVDAMAEGTGILDIARRIVEGVIRTGPMGGMGVVDIMTTLTAFTASAEDADVKTGVAPRSAGFAVTGLANREIGLGIRAMLGAVQIGPVQRMGHLAGTGGMAAEAIEAG